MAIKNIGFIGLGNMGGPMARNLLKAGYKVKAFDLSSHALQTAAAAGAVAVSSAQAAASDAEAVITMLPAGMQVREIYLGKNGVIAAARKGTLLIDS